eukprot:scaffold334_cov241-Pinguiococcus_pyrenoidosus.AAC.65
MLEEPRITELVHKLIRLLRGQEGGGDEGVKVRLGIVVVGFVNSLAQVYPRSQQAQGVAEPRFDNRHARGGQAGAAVAAHEVQNHGLPDFPFHRKLDGGWQRLHDVSDEFLDFGDLLVEISLDLLEVRALLDDSSVESDDLIFNVDNASGQRGGVPSFVETDDVLRALSGRTGRPFPHLDDVDGVPQEVSSDVCADVPDLREVPKGIRCLHRGVRDGVDGEGNDLLSVRGAGLAADPENASEQAMHADARVLHAGLEGVQAIVDDRRLRSCYGNDGGQRPVRAAVHIVHNHVRAEIQHVPDLLVAAFREVL